MRIKTAVITGGANGIGRASAICLAQEGVDIALIDREVETVAETASELQDLGVKAIGLAADATDETTMKSTFAEIQSTFGEIDMLLNNVGGTAKQDSKEFFEQDSDVWRRIIDQCLVTTFTCSRLVVPAMRTRKFGKIVNIASDSALVGDLGQTDYAASKMGVIGFTRSLARELAPHGVNVNAVCPGLTKTRALGMLRPELLKAAEDRIPMQRSAEPWEIGKAVAFLASDDSNYITGQSLLVDGGRWMV